MRAWGAAALAALALFAAIPAAAQPSGVQVSPILIGVSAESGLAAVRVRNWRAQETAFEATLLAWTQADGADVLVPAPGVVIAPSVFAIAPGAEQIVRIGAPPAQPGEGERAYRLILREIGAAQASGGLRVQLQFSLPAFVTPEGAAPLLAVRREGGRVWLENEGDAHARLARLSIDGAAAPAPRYLLAGARLALPAGARSVDVAYAGGDHAGAARTLTQAIDGRAQQASVR